MADPRRERNLRLPHSPHNQRHLHCLPERPFRLQVPRDLPIHQDRQPGIPIEHPRHMHPLLQRQRGFGHHLLPNPIHARAQPHMPKRIHRQRKTHLLKLALIRQRQPVPRIAVQRHPRRNCKRVPQRGHLLRLARQPRGVPIELDSVPPHPWNQPPLPVQRIARLRQRRPQRLLARRFEAPPLARLLLRTHRPQTQRQNHTGEKHYEAVLHPLHRSTSTTGLNGATSTLAETPIFRCQAPNPPQIDKTPVNTGDLRQK